MTAVAGGDGTATTVGSRRGAIGFGLAVVIALVVIAVVAGTSGGRTTGPALSPRSVSGSGTKALVLLLEQHGVQVHDSGVPDASQQGVGLLLRDDLSSAQRSALRRWVRDGNTLVVADPNQAVVDSFDLSDTAPDNLRRGPCTIDGLDGVQRLDATPLDIDADTADPSDLTSGVFTPGGLFTVPERGSSCFGVGDAFVVSQTLGSGTVVAVGSPVPFVNERLDDADNAAFAVDLLTTGSATEVTLIDSTLPGAGDTSVLDLVPARVKQALAELVLAFLLYAWWRAWRLGRPVTETQPVAIPGSALVGAVGGLRRRNGGVDQAAASLRDQTTRALARRFGLGRQTPPAAVAAVVAERTGLDPQRLHNALTYQPIGDENQLVAYVAELDRIRQEVLDGTG